MMFNYFKKKDPPIEVRTPLIDFQEKMLSQFGKFPLNKVWSIIDKFKYQIPFNDQEKLLLQTCLLKCHNEACFQESSLFVNDNKTYYEAQKIMKIPIEELPLIIGSVVTTEGKEVLEYRLKISNSKED